MKRAIHHVELNERLQTCFDKLDELTRTYRNYNKEYVEIVAAHPQEADQFFRAWEEDCMEAFKMKGEGKREEIE